MTLVERTGRLGELVEVGIALSSEPDPSRLLDRIVSLARRFTGAEAGTLFLRGGSHLRFAVVQNEVLIARHGEEALRPLLDLEPLPLDGPSLVGHVALTGKVLNVPDAYAIGPDRPFRFSPEVDRRTGYRTRSVLAVPLADPTGQVMGVLQLINARDAQQRVVGFDPAVEEPVRALASHGAVALRNARLLAENEERQRSLAAQAEVGRLLSQTLDVERVGQQIVDSLRSLVGVRSARLFSREPDSGNLMTIAVSGELADGLARNVVLPPGAGAAGRAVRDCKRVVTVDLLTDDRIEKTPEMRASLAGSPDRAVLAVPLVVREVVIGALSLRDRTGRRFGPEEIRLAQTFADLAAVALDRARLCHEHERLLVETRQQHQEALALASVAREITSSLQLTEILQRVVERARELCGADLAVLACYDRDAGVARRAAVAGALSDALASLTIAPGASVEGIVLETGEPFETADYLDDVRVPGGVSEAIAAEGVVAEAVVPLRFRGATTGLLLVGNRTPRPFTGGHLVVLDRLADQAAISIENARLCEEAQHRLQHTEMLLALSEAIGSTLDLAEVFRRTVRALVRSLGADMGGAWMVTPDRSRVVPMAGYRVPADVLASITPDVIRPDALITRVLRLEEPLFAEDSQADPRLDHAWACLVPHRSVLVFPMHLKDRTIGGFIIVWQRRRPALTEDERRVMKAIGREAAVAMENARLLDNVELLRRQNELILNSAGDGIYGVDRQGVATFVNAAAAKMTGYSPGELVGQSIHTVVHHSRPDGTPRPPEDCPIWTVLADGVPRHIDDDVFWRKDGTPFAVEYLTTPIVESGSVVGAVITFRDITERRQSEQARREAETLRSIASLARAAAHEINNPLNVVRGHLQLLRGSVAAATIEQHVVPAIAAVDRIQRIVRLLNRLTRIELIPSSGGLPEMLDFERSSAEP